MQLNGGHYSAHPSTPHAHAGIERTPAETLALTPPTPFPTDPPAQAASASLSLGFPADSHTGACLRFTCTRRLARTCSRTVQSMVTFARTVLTSSRAIVLSCSSKSTCTALSLVTSRIVEGQLFFTQPEVLAPTPCGLHLLRQVDQLGDDLRRLNRAVLVRDQRLLQPSPERARRGTSFSVLKSLCATHCVQESDHRRSVRRHSG